LKETSIMLLRSLSSVAALALCAGMACAQVANPEIKREATGERAKTLAASELKPFSLDALALLSDWSGGTALTAETLKGKPALFVTWQCWNEFSPDAVKKFSELTASNPDLIVVAVHDERKYDDAKKWLADNKIVALSARDVGGKFRKALKVDADPDVYVIDKAGNLRFADIEGTSVVDAVKVVAGESVEQAAAAPKAFKDAALATQRQAQKPSSVTEAFKLGTKTKVLFTPPDASAYEKAPWPKKNEPEGLSATDLQGQKLPGAESFGTKEYWVTEKPEWSGKVIMLDFWATWCAPCKRAIPMIEDLAKKSRDDLVVIGVGGQSEDLKTFERWLTAHEHSYSQCFDEKQTLYKAFGIQGIPHCVLISTDGTVRWQGNPLQPGFRRIAEFIIEADPGIKVRRNAEAEAVKKASAAAAAASDSGK